MLRDMIKPIVDINVYIEFVEKMNTYELGLISFDSFIEQYKNELKTLYVELVLNDDEHTIHKSLMRYMYQSWVHYCYYLYTEQEYSKNVQAEIYQMLFDLNNDNS